MSDDISSSPPSDVLNLFTSHYDDLLTEIPSDNSLSSLSYTIPDTSSSTNDDLSQCIYHLNDLRNTNAIYENDSESDPNLHTIHRTYTLEDAISYLDFGTYQWMIMFMSCFIWFSAAIQLMLTSVILLYFTYIESVYDMSSFNKGLLAAIPFVGEMMGAYMIGVFSDKYGRRNAIVFTASTMAIFSLLSAASYDFSMLVVCRCMAGFAVGGSLTCLSLFTEFTPKHIRGEMSFVQVSSWSLGAIYAIGMGWVTYSASYDWRWYLAFCAIPCWMGAVMSFFLPESPRWLLNNGDHEAVVKQLQQIAYWNNKQIVFLAGELEYHDAVDESHKGNLKCMFNDMHRMTSYLVLIATPCACAAYFGVALFQLSYFESEDDSIVDIFWELLLCTSSELPGMIFGILVFESIGRIPFLTVTFLVTTLCFIGLIFAGENFGIALIFIARMCISTSYNTLIVYILEYFPTTIRATALGFAITEARFAGIASSYVAEYLDTSSASIVFAGCCALATVCAFMLPYETLGRGLQDDVISDDMLTDGDTSFIQQTLQGIESQQQDIRAILAAKAEEYSIAEEEDMKLESSVIDDIMVSEYCPLLGKIDHIIEEHGDSYQTEN